ncbi:TlpA disulfide reductase family protein [Rufibacter sp. LB8]|nr:TlpA disulfide reductase family protein [Rufibacter sp. LB8]
MLSVFPASAQSKLPAKEGLVAGQYLPEVTLTNLVNAPASTAKLSDYKGKLLLLDFWSTWCGTCAASLPKIDNLQRQFTGQVQVLLVNTRSTRDDRAKVMAYYEKRRQPDGSRYVLPSVVEDTVLDSLFPHTLIPHVVWVSPQGEVLATTSHEQVTAANIRLALAGNTTALRRKKDVDLSRPLFLNAEAPTRQLSHYAILFQGQLEGVPQGTHLRRDPEGAVTGTTVTNQPLTHYFAQVRHALFPGLTSRQLVFAVRDSARLFQATSPLTPLEWNLRHLYSLDLLVPPSQADSLYFRLRDALHQYSGYVSRLENRPTDCLRLVRTGRRDCLRSKGGPAHNGLLPSKGGSVRNVPLSAVVVRLNSPGGPGPLVVDETGYPGPVDLELNTPLHDLPALRRELQRYGLDLRPARRQLPYLVVREAHNLSSEKSISLHPKVIKP